MQHPSLSVVWHYQTEKEQRRLLHLYDQYTRIQDQLDDVRGRQRVLLVRAYMRRKRQDGSDSLEFHQ